MLIELENNGWKASVNTLGAQLRRLYNPECGREVLWCGDAFVWSGVAPVLFPVIGRLRNQGYRHNGKAYRMEKHGFARTQEFTVKEQSLNRLVLVLKENNYTLECYPFAFSLEATITLEEGALGFSYRVDNNSPESMPFSLGSHPAFALAPENAPYSIVFNNKESLAVFSLVDDLLTVEGKPYLAAADKIELTPEIFRDGALIFKNIKSDKISIDDKNGRRLVSVETGGTPDLGLWAMPGAEYVCIEPWFGYDDDINGGGELSKKTGIINLPVGESFTTAYKIIVP